jgi:peptide-methionine (S)-S-oxide reductase
MTAPVFTMAFRHTPAFLGLLLWSTALLSCTQSTGQGNTMNDKVRIPGDTAIFGGGCFWCLEAVFERFDGVLDVVSGYAGGSTPDPRYEDVCSGATGHAEVVRVHFDAARISYEQLLDIFWQAHDPTTEDRQGADVGSQYRSVILYRDAAQRAAAELSREKAQAAFERSIVTTIIPLAQFFPAEEYHQDYFRKHPNVPYCAYVIRPKLDKLHLK